MIKILIIQNPKLIDRRNYLESKIDKFGLTNITEYVFFYDKNNLEESDRNKYEWSTNEDTFIKRKKIFDIPTSSIKTMNNMEIAITLEHLKCHETILNSDYEYGLILEDDVIFLDDNFKNLLDDYISQIDKVIEKNQPFILYIGKGLNPSSCVNENNIHKRFKQLSDNIYLDNEKHSQYSDSYLINKSACKVLLENSIPFYFAIDWELNYIHKAFNVLSLFSYPQLTVQGSNSNYGSSNN